MSFDTLAMTNVLVGILAAVSVLEALVLITAVAITFRLYRSATETARDIQARVVPLVRRVDVMAGDVGSTVRDVTLVTSQMASDVRRVGMVLRGAAVLAQIVPVIAQALKWVGMPTIAGGPGFRGQVGRLPPTGLTAVPSVEPQRRSFMARDENGRRAWHARPIVFECGLVAGTLLGVGAGWFLAGRARRQEFADHAMRLKSDAIERYRRTERSAARLVARGRECVGRVRTAATKGVREGRRHLVTPRDPRHADLAGVAGLADTV